MMGHLLFKTYAFQSSHSTCCSPASQKWLSITC